MSIHTKPGCTMPANYNATASLSAGTNCDAIATGSTGRLVQILQVLHCLMLWNLKGCGLRSATANNYGTPFNSNGGGVYAMVWDAAGSDGIRVFFFPRSSIPADISFGMPQPNGWGIPQARWPASTCDPKQFFAGHVAVLDTTFWFVCLPFFDWRIYLMNITSGDWAGASSVWGASSQAGQVGSCQASTGYSTCEAYVRANGAAFANACG